jgi:hypothetical protein
VQFNQKPSLRLLVFDGFCGYYHSAFDAERHQNPSVQTLGCDSWQLAKPIAQETKTCLVFPLTLACARRASRQFLAAAPAPAD